MIWGAHARMLAYRYSNADLDMLIRNPRSNEIKRSSILRKLLQRVTVPVNNSNVQRSVLTLLAKIPTFFINFLRFVSSCFKGVLNQSLHNGFHSDRSHLDKPQYATTAIEDVWIRLLQTDFLNLVDYNIPLF